MHILVTGGAGFIGRHLVPALLERGHDVSIIDSLTENIHGPDPQLPSSLTADSRLIRADIRDGDAWSFLAEATPDAVIHLAAETGVGQSMYEVGRYTDVNIQGTSVMLDELRRHGINIGHFVLASSRAVYGEGSYHCGTCGTVTPAPRTEERLSRGLWEPLCPGCGADVTSIATREDAPRAPASVYAMTKSAQEDLVGIVAPTLGATSSILRYANIYGEGQPLTNPYTGVLSAFALRLVRGDLPKVYEDGNPTRDFVHVTDVARATVLAAESASDVTVNVGSGERWTLREIAQAQSRAFRLDMDGIEATGQYRLGDIRAFQADIAAARKALTFVPTVDLTEGLRRLCAWVREEAVLPEADVAGRAEAQLRQQGLLGVAGDA